MDACETYLIVDMSNGEVRQTREIKRRLERAQETPEMKSHRREIEREASKLQRIMLLSNRSKDYWKGERVMIEMRERVEPLVMRKGGKVV